MRKAPAFPLILVFAPAPKGGIAEHTKCQVEALRKAGAKVVCMVSPGFAGDDTMICLPEPPSTGAFRKIRLAWCILLSHWILALKVFRYRPDLVLLDSYREYLAPLWVWPHWLLARAGVRYAANLHDPVRDYVVGPIWWHRWSVLLGYKPLDFVLVHSALKDGSLVPPKVKVVEAPHGIYEMAPAALSNLRANWGARPDQKIFLSFGHVRDKKNLDLVLRAMLQVPEVFLVVAGSPASSKDKPMSFYQSLARELGVAERCRFVDGYIPQGELGGYFHSADFILLTYSGGFFSQSGVLQLAVHARKPVLASASPSALTESVKSYRLGVVVEPDSEAAIVLGIQTLLSDPPIPDWEGYKSAASWEANAGTVLRALAAR